MKIGRLRIKTHWFKPFRSKLRPELNCNVDIITANTFNTRGYIISFFHLHIFVDWCVREQ